MEYYNTALVNFAQDDIRSWRTISPKCTASKASVPRFVVVFQQPLSLAMFSQFFFWDAGCSALLLQLVFQALSWGSSVTFALAKLTVENGFGHSGVLHARQVPLELGRAWPQCWECWPWWNEGTVRSYMYQWSYELFITQIHKVPLLLFCFTIRSSQFRRGVLCCTFRLVNKMIQLWNAHLICNKQICALSIQANQDWSGEIYFLSPVLYHLGPVQTWCASTVPGQRTSLNIAFCWRPSTNVGTKPRVRALAPE